MLTKCWPEYEDMRDETRNSMIHKAPAGQRAHGCDFDKFLTPPRGYVALSSVMGYVKRADGSEVRGAIYVCKAERVQHEEHDHRLDPLGVKLWNEESINRYDHKRGISRKADAISISLWDGKEFYACSQEQARKDIRACHEDLTRWRAWKPTAEEMRNVSIAHELSVKKGA